MRTAIATHQRKQIAAVPPCAGICPYYVRGCCHAHGAGHASHLPVSQWSVSQLAEVRDRILARMPLDPRAMTKLTELINLLIATSTLGGGCDDGAMADARLALCDAGHLVDADGADPFSPLRVSLAAQLIARVRDAIDGDEYVFADQDSDAFDADSTDAHPPGGECDGRDPAGDWLPTAAQRETAALIKHQSSAVELLCACAVGAGFDVTRISDLAAVAGDELERMTLNTQLEIVEAQQSRIKVLTAVIAAS
jgi:hypothetical protein